MQASTLILTLIHLHDVHLEQLALLLDEALAEARSADEISLSWSLSYVETEMKRRGR